MSVAEAAASTRQTTEGVKTAGALLDRARAYDITMPITEVMYVLLHEKATLAEAAAALMQRAPKPERTDQLRNRKNRGSAGGRLPACGKTVRRQRRSVECGVNRLNRHRAVAAMYHPARSRRHVTHIKTITCPARPCGISLGENAGPE
ncbi:hypothetical protein EYS09_18800 [Streptomyces kasugaensis]|uniref:Glycerol-3-phosphate dehydrogenase NAD-dependent C-terminal domain-containing protein n=1 Tax=Streptomyces kasugaensis TaxID=1946 RepID=A0A4Q9HSZ7_STRKA|nr:hypothetical protein EYS09_18800 [Streptomyces kasugaensis]